jgi:plastocyanin
MKRIFKPVNYALLAVGVAAVPALAADITVTQKNLAFSTNALSVHVGDLVHFDNPDAVTHNITITGPGPDGDSEDLGLQKPGAPLSFRFAAKGRYRVVCSIHPRMKMTVNVQ